MPSSDRAGQFVVELKQPLGAATGRLVLLVVLLVLALVIGVTLIAVTAMKGIMTLAVIGLSVGLMLKIVSAARFRKTAAATSNPSITIDGSNLQIPPSLAPEGKAKIELTSVSRIFVDDVKRGIEQDNRELVIEIGTREGTLEARIGESWFPGGRSQMQEAVRQLTSRLPQPDAAT